MLIKANLKDSIDAALGDPAPQVLSAKADREALESVNAHVFFMTLVVLQELLRGQFEVEARAAHKLCSAQDVKGLSLGGSTHRADRRDDLCLLHRPFELQALLASERQELALGHLS